MPCKPLLLRFHANVENYEVTVYSGCEVHRKRVFAREGCLCLHNPAPCVRVVASPLQNGYSAKLYYWLDTTCTPLHCLYFAFPQEVTPPPFAVNTFTLTDATYGLPIDGALLFAQS